MRRILSLVRRMKRILIRKVYGFRNIQNMMDKAGDDLDSFLNDFWLYLEECSKSMEDENPAIERLLYLWKFTT
jgi:hypothetical protein